MAGDLPYDERLVVLDDGSAAATSAPTAPGRILHRYGDRVRIMGPLTGETLPDIGVQAVPADEEGLSPTERLGIAALRLRESDEYREAKRHRPRQAEAWDMPGGCTEQGRAGAPEALGPGIPRGASTSRFLEGRVGLSVLVVDGPSPDLQFTDAERIKIAAEVQNGLTYLATANPAAAVTFVHQIQSVSVTVRGDSGSGDPEGWWRDPVMIGLGYSVAADGLGAVDQYVRDLRAQLGTRWAYCAFFVKYPLKRFASAHFNGPSLAMQFANDGWGPDNLDRVFAHETGHVFGCPDEYSDQEFPCDCGGAWGRFRKANLNCVNCAPGGGVECLMRDNDWRMCSHTPGHLGWTPSRLIAQHSLKAADVSGGSVSSGALLIQWPYSGAENQAIRCDHVGGGYFRLVAVHSGKVLDVSGGSTANGAKVIQWDWTGGDNQLFRLEPLGDGYVRVTVKRSGKVLDVAGASTGDGAELVQWEYHGGANQRWLLGVPVTAAHSGKLMRIEGAATGDGAALVQSDYHTGAEEILRFERVVDDVYRIVAQHSGKVLQIEGASTDVGARVVQWNRHDADHQLFHVQMLEDGNARITAKHSGRVLEVAAGSQDVGAPVVQADWTGDTNQRWLVPQLLLASGNAVVPKQGTADREAERTASVSPSDDARSWTPARSAGRTSGPRPVPSAG